MIVMGEPPEYDEKYPGGKMLGATYRARRVRAGLTLRGAAALLGLTMTELSAVESGQRPFTEDERDVFDREVP